MGGLAAVSLLPVTGQGGVPTPAERYSGDVLATNWRRPKRVPEILAEADLVVEDAASGWCGAIAGWDKTGLVLEDRHGRRRTFPWSAAGFLLDGEPVTLVRPRSEAGPLRSASGSTYVEGRRARVARAGRIYVEGRHDAELVEKVWGHDLRVEGVVVEPLGGVDDLPAVVKAFRPAGGRRLGVLVDHLVPGSKEFRLAAQVTGPHVLVLGHPYVDVWQGVRPDRLGLQSWPEIPRGTPWKHGVCAALGWPHEEPADIAAAWQRILGAVRSYADLEPALLARVEELIDFVTG